MTTVSEAWSRIDRWLARHAPASAALLAPPADPLEIASAEATLGLTFPPQLVESLRCHNGVVNEAGLLPGKPLLSVAGIVKMRQALMPAVEYLDEDGDPWWHPLWLPFASSDSDSQFMDLRPGSFERLGWHWHDAGANSDGGWRDLEEYLSVTPTCWTTAARRCSAPAGLCSAPVSSARTPRWCGARKKTPMTTGADRFGLHRPCNQGHATELTQAREPSGWLPPEAERSE